MPDLFRRLATCVLALAPIAACDAVATDDDVVEIDPDNTMADGTPEIFSAQLEYCDFAYANVQCANWILWCDVDVYVTVDEESARDIAAQYFREFPSASVTGEQSAVAIYASDQDGTYLMKDGDMCATDDTFGYDEADRVYISAVRDSQAPDGIRVLSREGIAKVDFRRHDLVNLRFRGPSSVSAKFDYYVKWH